MSILRRAAGREARSIAYGQGDPYAIPSNGTLASYASSGVSVDKQTAMSLSAVWASVRILSSVVASTPINTVRVEDTGKVRKVAQHPLIANPFGNVNGAPLDRQVGFEQMMVSKLLRGNSYNLITEYDRRGTPTQIMPIDPDIVRVDPLGGLEKRFWIAGKQIHSDEIVHVPALSMPGAIVGISPVAYLRETIGLGLATQEFGARFFGNGATMSGIVEVDGDLDPDAARQLKERFTTRHSGLRNSHGIGVLTGGAKFKPITIAPNEAQFIESMQYNVSAVAMIFGIPPHLLGNTQDVSAAWGAGVEPQNRAFLTYTLRAWYTRIENALSNLLPDGLEARFDTQDLLRTDAAARSHLYSSARVAGWMTTDEIRDIEGLDPIPGGDRIDQPLNSAHNGDIAPTAPASN